MKNQIGSRVGAILGTEDKTVKFFGYGIYEGNFIPEENSGGFGKVMNEIGIINPRIRLDNGKVVYGCECWWGSEEEIKNKIMLWEKKDYKIINVDIDEVRKGSGDK